ncbi:MAG: TAXI family TRAP transporter solute-binding subunit [Rhodoferax sp.]|nr:TAXI family TRAP transporter solute-binding subunit [Rhodoferax sp.]
MHVPASMNRRWLTLWAALAVLIAVLTWGVLHFVSPAPPRTLTMSTGAADGAYHQFGLKYQRILKASGINLVLQPSSGAVENLQRLNDDTTAVAFVQGGLGPLTRGLQKQAEDTPLRSLATIGFEPVWIFSHTLDLSGGLNALTGKRVAVGVAGSGNYQVAMDLLKAYGVVDAQGQPAAHTTLISDGGLAAASELERHQIDAIIMVAAPQAPAVQQLLANPAIHLASLVQTEGLARRFPYFQSVSLKRGSVDPQHNLPPQDIDLLATTANLVIAPSLHPALAYLLLEAASRIHHPATLLNRPGDFPSPKATDFPLTDEADHFFRSGRPFLQNYLPFWAAVFVQRLILLLVPLLAILVPLFRVLPPLFQWKQQGRLYRRYGELKFLEKDLASRSLSAAERETAHAQLDQIESDAIHAKFPLDFSDRVYTLRQHVDYVRAQIDRQAEHAAHPAPGTS